MNNEIRIEYCSLWNYEPQAVSLTAKLLRFKQDIRQLTLVPSSGGAFEISVNGTKLYSKKETGKFPDEDAIVEKIAKWLWFIGRSVYLSLFWFAVVFNVGSWALDVRCSSFLSESDGCLVALAVFKTVVSALCVEGLVRFLPSPPAAS